MRGVDAVARLFGNKRIPYYIQRDNGDNQAAYPEGRLKEISCVAVGFGEKGQFDAN